MPLYQYSTEEQMAPDVRPWYHLLYITDQIKNADNKAYIGITVLCAVIGLSHEGFTQIIRYLAHDKVHPLTFIIISSIIVSCIGGLILSLIEFNRILFPQMNSKRHLDRDDKSAIFWLDVAMMTYDEFKRKYRRENREDDLIVQIYILSKIAQIKYNGIKTLFKISIFTTACDVTILILAKVLTQ